MKDRKQRVRYKNKRVSDRNRLTVFRSNNHLYAQLIDDGLSKTLVSSDLLAGLSLFCCCSALFC